IFDVNGPTLPERLAEADWRALAAAMQARGIPAFMAAKMQPWYVSMLLGIPPCAIEDVAADSNGLDSRIIARAAAQDIPVRALEPYDTVFELFDSMPPDDQIDLIRTTLAMVDKAEDYTATLTAAYFAEDVRVTWELGRIAAGAIPGQTPEQVDAELALMEENLMFRRNRAWIPVIEAAAEEGPVFAAFGALHLSGTDGVLALLQRAGFVVERLPF
ncbi:MAG: TraB/GumN family protein, partial [Albidovulum sp.]